jgi:SAM-dependent methyltransferase
VLTLVTLSPPQPRYYDPTNLHSEGTLRGEVFAELLRRRDVPLTQGHLLDLGCGYGGLSIHAARNGATVTSIDTSDHKLEVLGERIAGEYWPDGGSISPLKANATELPLESAMVDQAVTLGVIEWVPLTTPGEDPRTLQVRALAEIARVLKPGGTYILGTQNRWYPPYLLHEPQTRWPLVNHLPRGMARPVSQAVFGQAYRTYIHSLDGWRSMLQQAGFRAVRTFLPIYFYQFPIDLWPIGDSERSLDRARESAAPWVPDEYLRVVDRNHPAWKRAVLNLMLRTGLAPRLWSSYLFVATA